MKIKSEQRKKQYRVCYEILFEKPRIHAKDASLTLKVDQRTASKRIREALQQQYIVGPEIRKKSYKNLKEYMYFVNCKDPEVQYAEYCKDTNIIYHAVISGFSNLWVISKEKIDIEGDIILEGYRSDYHVAFVPYRSWDDAIQIMKKKIETFNAEEYMQKGYIKTHFDEPVNWNAKDETLYRYFKYNLRKPPTPVMEDSKITGWELYDWLEKLPEYCTIFTAYYPEKFSSYDSFLSIFETDYEDFIIDLFSELPASSFYFKVSDKLFLYAHLPKNYVRNSSLRAAPKELHISLMCQDLMKREIIKNKAYALVWYSWAKDL